MTANLDLLTARDPDIVRAHREKLDAGFPILRGYEERGEPIPPALWNRFINRLVAYQVAVDDQVPLTKQALEVPG